ncbi:MAG: hypothetical protein HXY21_04180 [Parvularculaceae bacterium]|nr:hypothetical protein [Parvularculaceae bacterium]
MRAFGFNIKVNANKEGDLLRIRFVLCALATFLSATPAAADYKSEYKLYRDAFEAGDLAGALEHSGAAWKLAEAEIGDHEKTAILAFNYANLVYDFDIAKAHEAYKRALSLTEAGIGALPVEDLRLAVSVSALALDVRDKDLANAAKPVLKARQASGAGNSFMDAEGWKQLAMYDLSARQYKDAKTSSDLARSIAEKLAPKPERLIAETLSISGVALVIGANSRTSARITEAIELLDRAIVMFPPQKDIDSVHPLFAQAMLWRLSIEALASSENRKGALKRVDKELDADAMSRWEQSRPADCELKWKKRLPPRFPAVALEKNQIAAVLVGYDLNETGVERTVLIAALNGETFSKPAIESMADWELEAPVREACRKNHITVFKFVIGY